MNIVERLRVTQTIDTGNGYYRIVCDPLRVEAADLIEQQAERIKELESWRDSWVKCPEGAAAQRIKELEAALCEETEARSKWYCEADRLKEDLTTLRSKIENAEVFGIEYRFGKYNTMISKDDLL